MAALLTWFAFGGAVVAISQFARLPWLALGESMFAVATGSAAFALLSRRAWAPDALKVVAFAALPLVGGMVASFPATLKGDAWLSGLLALAVWCPLWLTASRWVRGKRV